MSAEESSGLFRPPPREQVVSDLVHRSRRRFEQLADADLEAMLEDALWNERKRVERKGAEPTERARHDALAKALVRGDREARVDAGLALVKDWADEIHGRFDPRLYRVATRVLPTALAGLLSGRPRRFRDVDLSPENRIVVKGNLPLLRTLASEATLILTPTHVSNLDSPIVGLALYLAGLPPFVYGAGLNLFSNPVVGFWMHRLGAYTVDRTKKATLYKDVLKDYSVRALTTRHHSLFFPGGTRSRNGELETKLKKGLLGTGIVAWQEMVAAKRPDSEVYVIPLTLSYTLVLEAATLMEDYLAEAGKQRYIISDDEFAQPRRLLAFARRVLDLDSSIVAHFGDPLDVLGNPVSADPTERKAQAEHRRQYICDRDGAVQWDGQRDHTYTLRLSDAITDRFVQGADPMATQVAATAAWRMLSAAAGTKDPFQVVRTPIEKRRLPLDQFLGNQAALLSEIRAGAADGRWLGDQLPADDGAVLDVALDRFGRYHRSLALVRRGNEIIVEDPKLCLYYANRLTFLDRPGRLRPLGQS